MLIKKTNPFLWAPLALALLALIIIHFFKLNVDLFYWGNSFSSVLGGFWAHATLFGDGLIVAVLLLPFLRKRPDILWAMLWTVIVFSVILHSLKSGLNFPRPPFVLPHDSFFILGPAHKHHAFPSGHTATAFAYAGVLAFSFKNGFARAGLFAAALLVGLSRIGVGVHWPADVAAGLVVGWGSAWIGWWISAKISIKSGFVFKIIFGPILIVAAIILIFQYNTNYPQADWLRYAVGGWMLIWGLYEFIRMFLDRRRG
jgi:membrane-associated phospholipid phosphatase